MTDHLKDIATYYFLDPEEKLNIKPVHLVDAYMIESIIAVLNKTGSLTLAQILSRWKKDADRDVLDALDFYLESEQLEEEMAEKAGDGWGKIIESMKRAFVTLQDESIIVNHIHSVKRTEVYTDRPMYGLLINKEEDVPAQYQWYINKEILWASEEARDLAFEELKKDMVRHTMSKFI